MENEEINYLKLLLLYRISKCVLGSFNKGNCGELVAYSTFFLLQERYNNDLNFNLEVMQLTSNLLKPDNTPFTHVIGVIDREVNSPAWPPSLWGNDAVAYDPWNNGAYFSARHMIERDYYKHGKWKKCETIASFNISRDNLSSFFTSYEKYIIKTEIPLGILFDYIKSHNF